MNSTSIGSRPAMTTNQRPSKATVPVQEASSMGDYNAVSSFSSSYLPGTVEVNRHAEAFAGWMHDKDQGLHDANPDARSIDVTLAGKYGVACNGHIRVEAKDQDSGHGYTIDRMVTNLGPSGEQFADHLEIRDGNVFGQEVYRTPGPDGSIRGRQYTGTVEQGSLTVTPLEGTQAQVAYAKIMIELAQLPKV